MKVTTNVENVTFGSIATGDVFTYGLNLHHFIKCGEQWP